MKAAVIGVGHLGRHHARIYSELDGIDLLAVVDSDEPRGRENAEKYGAEYLSDYRGLSEMPDLVSIAVPTVHHFEVASWFLERGVAVLVEKPMTATLDEARRLTDLASSKGVCLQVGHVERFHPVMRAAKKFQLEPRFIEAHRLAPFSFRSTDIGVVLDLMIHDLDIVLHLVRSPLRAVHASGGALLSSSEDIASARLEFENGAVVNLTASRVSLKTMRCMRLFSRQFYLSLDFDKKYAFMAKKSDEFDDKLSDKWQMLSELPPGQLPLVAPMAFRDLIEIQELDLDDLEPLKAEIESFVDSVRRGTDPEVPGEEALLALEAADRVLAEIRRHAW